MLETSPIIKQTIAARLTAEIPAAIATIGVRGSEACRLVARFARSPSHRTFDGEWNIGQVRYGIWHFGTGNTGTGNIGAAGSDVGEQIVLCRRAMDRIEVHCHGGIAVCNAILSDLASVGCRIVSQRDWPSALVCPMAQAAEQDLLLATTDRAAAVLLDQMSGALTRAMAHLQRLLESRQLLSVEAGVQSLLKWSDFGIHLAQGWKVVLVGPPNVGKSSLTNELVGTQQVIVHHEPGTTRDWIECRGAIDGWPVAFTDTAGVREVEEVIEQRGVELSLDRLRHADLAIVVVDATQGWTDQHERLFALSPPRKLIAWNKADLCREGKAPWLLARPELYPPTTVIPCSSLGAPGVNALRQAVARILVPEIPEPGTAVPFRQEQVDDLESILRFLEAQRFNES